MTYHHYNSYDGLQNRTFKLVIITRLIKLFNNCIILCLIILMENPRFISALFFFVNHLSLFSSLSSLLDQWISLYLHVDKPYIHWVHTFTVNSESSTLKCLIEFKCLASFYRTVIALSELDVCTLYVCRSLVLSIMCFFLIRSQRVFFLFFGP